MRTLRATLLGLTLLFPAANQCLAAGDKSGAGGEMVPETRYDPTDFFNGLSNGKGVWVRSEIADDQKRSMFDRLAEAIGTTNGQITLEQFLSYSQERKAIESRGAVRYSGGKPIGPIIRTKDRFSPSNQGQWTPPPAPTSAKVIIRGASDVPKDIPAWFRQLDTDRDGQVGLYEWKVSGRSIQEFKQYDRNNDGFITIEEVRYYMAQQAKNASANESESAMVKINKSGTSGPASTMSGINQGLRDRISFDPKKSSDGKRLGSIDKP